MKNYIKLFLLLSLFFAGCSSEKQKEPEQKVVQNADKVSLTEEQVKIVGIKLGDIETKNLRQIVKSNGRLELPPQKLASVSSYIGGVAKSVNVISGDHVHKGDVLAVIEHPEIVQMQQDYLKAQTSFTYLEKEYERQKELYKENVVAGKKFQLAEADYNSQRAQLQSLKNKLQIIGINPDRVSQGSIAKTVSLIAPIAGYVNLVAINVGSYVNPATEIFSIVDLSHVHLILNVYERDIDKVEEGQKIHFTLSESGAKEYDAEVFNIGKALNQRTKSIEVHAEISKNNKDAHLLPGRYAEARIETGSGDVPALPNEAIISNGDINYIFIKTGETSEKSADGKEETKSWNFERVEVKTGTTDLGYTEVHPLTNIAGKKIVVKGAYYVASELEKNMGGEGEE